MQDNLTGEQYSKSELRVTRIQNFLIENNLKVIIV